MVSKEEFNKVFEATSRDGILNQFYYEHIELIELKQKIDKAIKFMEDTFVVDESDKCITELYELLQGSDEE